MKEPLISIIAVHFGPPAPTLQWWGQLQALTYPHWEAILIDQGTGDEVQKKLGQLEQLTYLPRENEGYAAGLNAGLRLAKGDFFLLMNTDLLFPANSLELLLQVFMTKPKVGLVSPLLLQAGSPARIQYAGSTALGPLSGRNQHPEKGKHWDGQVRPLLPTAYPHGAMMMSSREGLEIAGLLPTTYFLYYEELAWAEQFSRHHRQHWCQGALVVEHLGGLNLEEASAQQWHYYVRNRRLLMKDRGQALSYAGFCLYFYLVSLPILLLRSIIKGRLGKIRAIWKGAWVRLP
ncbi:MAG: glycosyltransferase [Bacteroidota bacterium]